MHRKRSCFQDAILVIGKGKTFLKGPVASYKFFTQWSHIFLIINWHPRVEWVNVFFFFLFFFFLIFFQNCTFLNKMYWFVMLFCLTAFQVSFYCPGTTEGEVDMTFSLNYTRIVSGSVDTEEIKSFMLTVRRRCEKTGNWHWIRHYHFAFLQGFFFLKFLVCSDHCPMRHSNRA